MEGGDGHRAQQVKLAFGAVVWLGFLAYVVILGGRATRAGLDADVAAHEREALAPTHWTFTTGS